MKDNKIESRLEEVERKLAVMEEHRRQLIPAHLASDPNVKVVLKDALQNLTSRLTLAASAKTMDEATTRFTEAKEQCRQQFEATAKAGEQREAAEIAAAIEYYERTGQSPPGYEIREEVSFFPPWAHSQQRG